MSSAQQPVKPPAAGAPKAPPADETPKYTENESAFAIKLAAMPQAEAFTLIKTGDPATVTPGVASALLAMGNKIISRQPDKALPLYEMELAIGHRLNDSLIIAKGLFDEGDAHMIMGNQEAAVDSYNQSVDVYKTLKVEPMLLASVYTSRAVARRNMGDMAGSVEDGNIALGYAREGGDEVAQARTLNNLGNAERALGHYTEARKDFEEGLKLARAHNQRQGEGFLLNNIAETYMDQENYALASSYIQQAIKVKEELPNKNDLVSSLTTLARIQHEWNKNADALQTIERANSLAKESGKAALQVFVLSAWGTIEDDQKNYPAALEKLNQALVLSRKDSQFSDANDLQQQVADVELHMGRYVDAERDASQTLAFSQKQGLTQTIVLASYTLGQANRKLGNLDASRASFQRAVDTVEKTRDNVAGGSQARAEYFAQRAEVYRALAVVDVMQGRLEDALRISEREKGRELLDMLTQGKTSLSSDLTPEEKSEEGHLNVRLTLLETQRRRANAGNGDAARLASIDQQLSVVRDAISTFREHMYASHPEIRRHRGDVDLITMEQIAGLLPNSTTAIVEFEETSEATYVFAITAGAAGKPILHVYTVPITGKALDARIASFQTALTTRDPGYAAAAGALYRLLLAPAKSDLAGKKTLILVPSGELWHLPFQALQVSPGRFLVDNAAISYAPSLSVLRAYAAKRASTGGPQTLLALGDPGNDLPEAGREVHTLEAIYGTAQTRTFTGGAANKANFFANAGTYDVVHLATHGTFDDHNPMYSHLLMAGVGGAAAGTKTAQLDASEIADIKMNASLVVLSACETAKGQYQAGEGLIGLSWSFLAAGSQSAVASQWRVESSSTTDLMIAFHRGLERHLSKAEALRHAEMKLEHDPQHRHPFYWAGFILLGNS